MRWKICLAIAAAVPASAFAQPAASTSAEVDRVYDDVNAPVFATSAVMFAAAYGASALTVATGDSGSELLVPLAGPWLALDQRPSCDATVRSCDHETTVKLMLVGDGILQAAGFLGMLDGILEPTSHVARHRLAQDTSVHLRPMLVGVQDAPGFGVSGHF